MLTDKEVFKELWTWLAEHPNSYKGGWPGWDVFDVALRYADYERCPACRTAELRSIAAPGTGLRGDKCRYCPLMKSASESKFYESDAFCLGGIFVNWLSCSRVSKEDLVQRRLLAEAIRDLDWEEEVQVNANDNDGVQGEEGGVLPS